MRDRRNFLENEMARLKISPRRLVSKTGVPEADTLIGNLIGEYAVEYIVPILQNSEEYKSLDGVRQAEFVIDLIDDYKSQIMKLARHRSRYAGVEKYGFDAMGKSEFNKIKSTYQNKAYEEYHKVYGKPEEGEHYNYSILTDMAKGWEKIGVR